MQTIPLTELFARGADGLPTSQLDAPSVARGLIYAGWGNRDIYNLLRAHYRAYWVHPYGTAEVTEGMPDRQRQVLWRARKRQEVLLCPTYYQDGARWPVTRAEG